MYSSKGNIIATIRDGERVVTEGITGQVINPSVLLRNTKDFLTPGISFLRRIWHNF